MGLFQRVPGANSLWLGSSHDCFPNRRRNPLQQSFRQQRCPRSVEVVVSEFLLARMAMSILINEKVVGDNSGAGRTRSRLGSKKVERAQLRSCSAGASAGAAGSRRGEWIFVDRSRRLLFVIVCAGTKDRHGPRIAGIGRLPSHDSHWKA